MCNTEKQTASDTDLSRLIDDIHSLHDVKALEYRLGYYNEQYSKFATLILETELRLEELKGV